MYSNIWKPKHELKEMSRIVCINPQCHNVWYYESDRIWDNFTCIKCGSTWYAERQKTETQNGSTKI